VEYVVIPFVELIRATYDCKCEDGTPMRAFVTCDGEAQQIAVFQMVEMLALFETALIDFGKSPASCSAIAQSSDDSNFFKATKCVLKGSMDYINVALEKRIRDYLQTRVKAMSEQRFSSEKKNLMVIGLMKCVHAIKKVLTEDIIKDGYKHIGQSTVNFDQAMSRCK